MSSRDDSEDGIELQPIPSREPRTGESASFPDLPSRPITSAQDSSRLDEARAAFDRRFPPGRRSSAATTDDIDLSGPLSRRRRTSQNVGPHQNTGGRAKTTDDLDDSRRNAPSYQPSEYKGPKTGVFTLTKLAASSIKNAITDKSNPFKELGSASDILERAATKPAHELSTFDRIATMHVDQASSRADQLAQINRTTARYASSRKLRFASKVADAIDKSFNASARKELSRRASLRAQATGGKPKPVQTPAKPPTTKPK